MRLYLIIILLLLTSKSNGQWLKDELNSNDPYYVLKEKGLYEFSKRDIIKLAISEISKSHYSLDKSSKPKERLLYLPTITINFNEAGNPNKYEFIYCLTLGGLNIFRRKNMSCDTTITTFEYDSLNYLIHSLSRNTITSKGMAFEKEVFYFYDKEYKVVKEIVLNRSFNFPDNYPIDKDYILSDSNRCELNILYSSSKDQMVSVVNEFHPNYLSNQNQLPFRSAIFNCPFDSIFKQSPITLKRGIVSDSLGNIINPADYEFTDVLIVGPPKRTIEQRTFDTLNRLITEEEYDLENQLIYSSKIDYNSDGLINSDNYWSHHHNGIVIYTYKKRKN